MINIQLAVETMTRCGGNCSGCAMSSIERMQTDFNEVLVKNQLARANSYLNNYKDRDDIESVTLFLGQGDHFLIKKDVIPHFVRAIREAIPSELVPKTNVFITASAVGNYEAIKEKMDLFYTESIKQGIHFFIQVVFDTKKLNISDKFSKKYLNIIQYFKQKCGMTELTINMGSDLLLITPHDFHQWVASQGFEHVEMNWVNNDETNTMWKLGYRDKLIEWLVQWLDVYQSDCLHQQKLLYEINFLPFIKLIFQRFSHYKVLDGAIEEELCQSLQNNIYIDADGVVSLCAVGPIANLTPYTKRTNSILVFKRNNANEFGNGRLGGQSQAVDMNKIIQSSHRLARQITKEQLKHSSCLSCDNKIICKMHGTYIWNSTFNDKTYEIKKREEGDTDCHMGINVFLQKCKQILQSFSHHKIGPYDGDKELATIFNKNPIQHDSLNYHDNVATRQYFSEKRNW